MSNEDQSNPGDDRQPRHYPQGFFAPPPGSCQVLLIRHGQSEAYVEGRPFPLVDGHGDPRLTELGRFQARQVGERLRHEPVAAIYVSPLTRTQETAAPLARHLGLTPRVEPDLREVFLGRAEGGRLRAMFANDDPVVDRLRRTGDWAAIPGAESNRELTIRTVQAVGVIAERHVDEMVAVFCHGGVINAVLSYAVGSPRHVFFAARHTSVNHVVVGPGGGNGLDRLDGPDWLVRSFNDGSHAGTLTGDHPAG